MTAPSQVWAQSTPTEFAELSLQELFDMSIEEGNGGQKGKPWRVSYQFKKVQFDGYLDGDQSLNLDDVLWSGPGTEPRTNKNFPIVPTVIQQQAHIINLAYQLNPRQQLDISVPYIEQATDHISSVENYDFFVIATQGIGDVVLNYRQQLVETEKHLWWLSLGLSLPTGTIDEKGDTPRAPGDQQLPYTMQKGSGTFDIPLEFSYQSKGPVNFSLNFSATLRTGTNDRDYRLGNNYSIGARYRFELTPTLQTHLSIDGFYSQRIRGRDGEITVPGPFPFPASITNPALYGGKKINLGGGFSWRLSEDLMLTASASKPVYQYLNGPQPRENWRTSIQLSQAL